MCAGCSGKNTRNRHLRQTSSASRPIRIPRLSQSGRRPPQFLLVFWSCCSFLSSVPLLYLESSGVSVMNPNRPTRNAQQVRSIIQNMGRSIDEARTRRLGPSMPPGANSGSNSGTPSARLANSSPFSAMDMQIGASEMPASAPHAANASASAPTNTAGTAHGTPSAAASTPAPTTPPPVRSVGEMFESGAPRLKARPKKAN